MYEDYEKELDEIFTRWRTHQSFADDIQRAVYIAKTGFMVAEDNFETMSMRAKRIFELETKLCRYEILARDRSDELTIQTHHHQPIAEDASPPGSSCRSDERRNDD